MSKIVGLPHLILTVNEFQRSKTFYKSLFVDVLNAKVKQDAPDFYYLALNDDDLSIGITLCDSKFKDDKFNRYRVGLHHFALELENNEQIDQVYATLEKIRAVILHEPQFYPEYGDNYYAIYFEDPNGFKMEFVSFNK